MEIIIKDKEVSPRITLARDGRVTLKFSRTADVELIMRLKKLVNQVVDTFGIPEATLRAVVRQVDGKLEVRMRTDNGTYMKSIKEKPCLK